MILGNQNCNYYMALYCSNGLYIANFLNVADRYRADFWEVFHTGEDYDRDYIKEW